VTGTGGHTHEFEGSGFRVQGSCSGSEFVFRFGVRVQVRSSGSGFGVRSSGFGVHVETWLKARDVTLELLEMSRGGDTVAREDPMHREPSPSRLFDPRRELAG
jgi:hypothetical protein